MKERVPYKFKFTGIGLLSAALAITGCGENSASDTPVACRNGKRYTDMDIELADKVLGNIGQADQSVLNQAKEILSNKEECK